MAFKPVPYPKELTNASWQKKKGLIAKAATKDEGTGIGKSLDELQKAFAKIDWTNLDIVARTEGHGGMQTDQQIAAAVNNAKKEGAAIKGAYDMARAVEKAAEKLAGEWSKSKLIPKSATAAATEISKKAMELSFAIAPGTISAEINSAVKQMVEDRKKHEAAKAAIIKKVPGSIDKIIAEIKAKKVDLKTWPSFWSGPVRFVGTQMDNVLKVCPDVKDEAAKWRVHSNQCRKPKDEKELNAWLIDLVKVGTAMKPKVKV